MLEQTLALLKKYHIAPDKKLGQNFLINENVINEIIKIADIRSDDVILEIGPGLGILTKELIKKAKKVVSIDLDKKCCAVVRKELSQSSNVQVVHENILNVSNQEILDLLYDKKNAQGEYRVIANIPYIITSPILKKFTEQAPVAQDMILLVQKEVAKRVTAKPGRLSILGIAVQLYCESRYIITVPSYDFYPSPQVDSAVIHLIKHDKYCKLLQEKGITVKEFFQIVKIGFSNKRKKLYNNLASGLHIDANTAKQLLINANINEHVRAQEISIEQWIEIILVHSSKC